MTISNKILKKLKFKKDSDHNSFFLTKSKFVTVVICKDPNKPDDSIIFTVIGENDYSKLKMMKAKDYIKTITMYPRAILSEQTLSDTLNVINQNM